MFRCVCYTCETRNVYDEWGAAQETFNEHASDRHEVVLVRTAPAGGQPGPDSAERAPESRTAAGSDSEPAAGSDSNGRSPMDG